MKVPVISRTFVPQMVLWKGEGGHISRFFSSSFLYVLSPRFVCADVYIKPDDQFKFSSKSNAGMSFSRPSCSCSTNTVVIKRLTITL